MNYLEKRVAKLEDCLESSRGPETLEEIISAFERGEYGHTSVMSPVVAILANRNGGRLKEDWPAELVNLFVETLKLEPTCEGYRDRREGESEKEYLVYKIMVCSVISGYPRLGIETELEEAFKEDYQNYIKAHGGGPLSGEELRRFIIQKSEEVEEDPDSL